MGNLIDRDHTVADLGHALFQVDEVVVQMVLRNPLYHARGVTFRLEHMATLGSSRKRILIIDDEIDVRELRALLLERDGYRVARAEDGTEGLAMVQSLRPDLVITDHLMPGLSGREIVRTMRATPALASIPVIMVTGAPIDQALQDAEGTIVVEAFLRKPSTWKLLREVVRASLKDNDVAPPSRDSLTTAIGETK
jgi:CheY-like chemotaxis protein